MGIELKIIGEEEIVLTDFTIKQYELVQDDIQGKNEYLSRNIIGIELNGEFSANDNCAEAKEVNLLSRWSKITAHEKDAYRKVEVKLADANNEVYDTILFEEAFLVTYAENYNFDTSMVEFDAFIRDFDDTEIAVKI